MNTSKHALWLLKQLPDWQEKAWISDEAAHQLHKHYEPLSKVRGSNPVFIITGILGALLIGTGIISIFAYNWEEFGRGMRTFLSVTPLLIAQILFAYAYLKHRTSIAWTESSSAFLMLMLASSIALISQTYNIPGNMADFLQTWMILSIPLLYLTNSTLSCLIYLAGIVSWTFNVSSGGNAAGFWLFLLAALPHIWLNIKHKDRRIRANILGWASSISLCIALIQVPEWRVDTQGMLAYGFLFGLLYLLGRKFFGQEPHFWQRSFQSSAIIGVFVMSMVLAYEWGFDIHSWNEVFWGIRYKSWAAILNFLLGIIAFVAYAFLLFTYIRNKVWINYFVAFFPLLLIVGILIAHAGQPGISMILFNLFILAFGLFYIREGIRQERLELVNAGMFFLSALLVMRFFDQDISFLIKGIVFLIIGIGFLGVNYYLVKKSRKHEQINA